MAERHEYETVLYDYEDNVATITLNRPEQLNSFTLGMRSDLIAALDRSDDDARVRAVIVTGSGRAFCAGADISAGPWVLGSREDPLGPPKVVPDSGGEVALRIYRSLKPVIAAVNGHAVGVGITMTLPMDFRIVSSTARLGFVFGRRGIVPDGASSWFLPRTVGIARALDWMISGRIFDASEALAAGLAHQVCAAGETLPAARALAREIIARTAPESVAVTRQLLWRMLGDPGPQHAHETESRLLAWFAGSANAAEGVASFLEKRDPQWALPTTEDLLELVRWRDESQPRPVRARTGSLPD